MVLSLTLNPSVDHALFLDKILIGDTNRVQRVETDAGGKGVNLSRVLAELGGDTVATGFLGGPSGAYVRSVLASQGVVDGFVEIDGITRTNFSVEDAAGTPPTTFNQRGPTIQGVEWDRLLAKLESLLSSARWLAIGGSLPPGIPVDAFAVLTRMGHAAGVKVMLDADGEAQKLGLEAQPDFIKPNSPEAARLLGVPTQTDEEALAAARSLVSRVAPGGFVVLSRGKNGAILACGEDSWIGRSPQVQTRSSIGSGDSLIGGMLWAIESGRPLEGAFRWGLAAGAATATTDGSEIARRAVIESLWDQAIVTRS